MAWITSTRTSIVRTVYFDEVYQMLEDRMIESAIPILAIQWLALNRSKLRQKWIK